MAHDIITHKNLNIDSDSEEEQDSAEFDSEQFLQDDLRFLFENRSISDDDFSDEESQLSEEPQPVILIKFEPERQNKKSTEIKVQTKSTLNNKQASIKIETQFKKTQLKNKKNEKISDQPTLKEEEKKNPALQSFPNILQKPQATPIASNTLPARALQPQNNLAIPKPQPVQAVQFKTSQTASVPRPILASQIQKNQSFLTSTILTQSKTSLNSSGSKKQQKKYNNDISGEHVWCGLIILLFFLLVDCLGGCFKSNENNRRYQD